MLKILHSGREPSILSHVYDIIKTIVVYSLPLLWGLYENHISSCPWHICIAAFVEKTRTHTPDPPLEATHDASKQITQLRDHKRNWETSRTSHRKGERSVHQTTTAEHLHDQTWHWWTRQTQLPLQPCGWEWSGGTTQRPCGWHTDRSVCPV